MGAEGHQLVPFVDLRLAELPLEQDYSLWTRSWRYESGGEEANVSTIAY